MSALAPGAQLELAVERPVAGGRMLARADGRVVLVAGAIPGEVVRATIERVERGTAFARVDAVLEASADRRTPPFDPACGGSVYAHVEPKAQPALKRAVILDGLRRGGGVIWEQPLVVRPSPERGYRLRARLHVRGGRAGFFAEGTHQLCDAGPAAQLTAAALDAVQRQVVALGGAAIEAIELSENLGGDQRAVHLLPARGARVGDIVSAGLTPAAGITGISCATANGVETLAGRADVGDPVAALVGGAAAGLEIRRHAAAFFQGNRFLVGALAEAVADAVGDGPAVDLYAGVGLFAVALCARGAEAVTAVEGDPVSAADLRANAAPFDGRLRVETRSVEAFLEHARLDAATTVVVDPPRTGLSPVVSRALAASAARKLVYVSCDVATFARDVKILGAAGFAPAAIEGFDLFPNTAHVETLATLAR